MERRLSRREVIAGAGALVAIGGISAVVIAASRGNDRDEADVPIMPHETPPSRDITGADPTPAPTVTPEPRPTGTPAPDRTPGPSRLAAIQELVDEAEAGSTVYVPAGVYRETVAIDKPINLVALPGAEIRGSDDWSDDDWYESNGTWTSSRQVPEFSANSTEVCRSDNAANCVRREQVFIDGEILLHVWEYPGPGEFTINGEGRVVLGEAPAGRMVEVSTRTHWISGDADDVTIDGFIMRHAATSYQSGALENGDGSHWTVNNCDLSLSAAVNLRIVRASGHQITNCRIHDAGQLGASLYDVEHSVVEGNEIYGNNTSRFTEWESGGLKFSSSRELVITGNEAYDNDGSGLWGDVYNESAEVSFNRCYGNAECGIRDEICTGTRIHENIVYGNGFGVTEGPLQAGILVQDCRYTDVSSNVVAWNRTGIYVWAENRDYQIHDAPWNREGIVVYRNDIFVVETQAWDVYALAWRDVEWNPPPPGTELSNPENDNRGAYNRYFHANPSENSRPLRFGDEIFAWHDLEGFNDTLGEHEGMYLSEEDMSGILSDMQIDVDLESLEQMSW